jgi:hypothetical protein
MQIDGKILIEYIDDVDVTIVYYDIGEDNKIHYSYEKGFTTYLNRLSISDYIKLARAKKLKQIRK